MGDLKSRVAERNVGTECRLSGMIPGVDGLLLTDDDLRFLPLDAALLSSGELYLFASDGLRSPLWGVYAHDIEAGGLMLETATYDLQEFLHWYPLLAGSVSFRSASRDELRDYFYNLARQERLTALPEEHREEQL